MTAAEEEEKITELIATAARGEEVAFHISAFHSITKLPDRLRALRQLQNLHIDHNYQLKQVPACVGELTHLTWLNLSYNQLTSLPPEISRLRYLQRLHVNNNNLTMLPMELWNLKNLEELHCGANKLHALPTAVKTLPKLRELAVEPNPLLTEADIDGSDAFTLFQKVQIGDCSNCRLRFTTYTVGCTFHTVAGQCVPFAHYCCSEACLDQLLRRIQDDRQLEEAESQKHEEERKRRDDEKKRLLKETAA